MESQDSTKQVVVHTRLTEAGAQHFALGLDLARRTISQSHTHVCLCGDWFRCSQDPDQCSVPDPFVCPNCEQAQRDSFLSLLDPTRTGADFP